MKEKIIHINPQCPKCDEVMQFYNWKNRQPLCAICPNCGMKIKLSYNEKTGGN